MDEISISSAPFDEEDPILESSAVQSRTGFCRQYLPPLLLASVVLFALVVWLATAYTNPKPINQVKIDSLSAPKLVLRPDLSTLHYCGFDPGDQGSLPFIPTLTDNNYEVILAQGFIRHGDRFFDTGKLCWAGQQKISYECHTNDLAIPWTNLSDSSIPKPRRLYRKRFMTNRNDFGGNCMVGQLTEKGFHQEKMLGAIFSKAYVGSLLRSNLTRNEVFFRTDDVPRTVMSAQAFISGMYPDDTETGDGSSAVVDIWTMDFDRETEISNPHSCPSLTNNFAKAIQSDAYQQHIRTVTEKLRARLSPVIGIPAANITDTQFDCLFVSACRQTPLPELYSLDLIRDFEKDVLFKYYCPLQYPNRIDGTRISAGPLIREIFERMNDVIQSNTAQRSGANSYIKFFLYSGHDTGPIMLLLSAFSVEDDIWAPYASYITLELYKNKLTQDHAVRLVYNGKVLRFPGQPDSDLISFSSFRDLVLPVIPSREECPDIY